MEREHDPRLNVIFTLLSFLTGGLAIGTVVRYRPLDRPAARLQLPYALWLCFALYLNLTACQLNG